MKALILSSGGVDSSTCLGLAVEKYGRENVSTVAFFYGQKHNKELLSATAVAKYYQVEHYELNLANILQYSNCPLLQGSTEEIRHQSYAQQIAENGEGMVPTYVPFRNGLMLSAAGSLALSLYPEEEVKLYLGAHADDAAGNAYADCSVAFVEAMGKALSIGTYHKIALCAPFVQLNKAEIVALGLKLKVPYELTWSCYEGGDKPCGSCGTCIDRIKAFAANGQKDPTMK